MTPTLRVLLVEDSEDDAALLLRELRRGGHEPQAERVDTPAALRAAVARGPWDLVLCDWVMPRFSAPAALALLRELACDAPVIITSGAVSEATAVEAMRAGAADCVGKQNLARLNPAVDRELREAAARRAQHEAVRQVEELRAKGRETDRMVSAATHELRSPLGPIKLELYMLLQGKFGDLNAEQRQAAQIVDRSARQLEALIHDLFDVTRMQAGQLLVQPAPIDLAAVAREGVAAMQGPASEAGIALSLDAPVPAPVLADPLRMGQVLRNFVGNALKFTPAGGAIRVRVAAAGERVQLLVTDTGLGLRAEDLGRLFQPFSQVANPLHQKHSGAGLGLSISKGIADQHGGRVWAASDGPGHGSTFGFELPRRQG